YITSIALSGDHVFAGTYGSGVFRSINGGDWTPVSNGLTESIDLTVNGIVIVENTIIAGTVGGVFVSTDNGENWIKTLPNQYTNCLAANNNMIVAGTYNGVYVSTDHGKTWKIENSGLTNKSIRSVAIGSSTIAVGTEGGGVFLSPLEPGI